MPNFVWDDTDVALVLEVMPEVGTDGLAYHYMVERDGLRLEVSVFQYDGDVGIRLYRDGVENSVFHATMRDCSGIRRVWEKDFECLEFAPRVVFDKRYDGVSSMPFGVRVSIKPSLSISLFE